MCMFNISILNRTFFIFFSAPRNLSPINEFKRCESNLMVFRIISCKNVDRCMKQVSVPRWKILQGKTQPFRQIGEEITLKLSHVPWSCITILVHCPIYRNYTLIVVGRTAQFCHLLWKSRREVWSFIRIWWEKAVILVKCQNVL